MQQVGEETRRHQRRAANLPPAMHPNPASRQQQPPTQGRACRRSQGLGALQDDGAHEVLHAHLAVAVEVGLSDHLLALQRGREGAAVLQVRCGGSVGAQASCAVHACVRRGCRR